MANETSLENLSPAERDNLAALAKQLAENPKTRQTFLRLTKAANPDTVIPELDVVDAITHAKKPLEDKLAKMEAAQLEREVNERIRNQRAELREQGHTKEEIDAIEKLMVERQIPNHKTAADFFKLERQVAAPTPANYTLPKVPFPTKEQSKAAGGMKRHFLQDAHAAVDDLRSGRVKLH